MDEKLEELMRDTMVKAEKMVLEARSRDEFLAVNGSLLAVAQRMYVAFMGNEDTAKMFYNIADKLATSKD